MRRSAAEWKTVIKYDPDLTMCTQLSLLECIASELQSVCHRTASQFTAHVHFSLMCFWMAVGSAVGNYVIFYSFTQ